MAAVLACGTDCALSHRSCADKRGLRRTARSGIDVISPRRAGRGHAGIDAHTSATLLPRDVETVDGIRCTSVARTLLDLGAVLPHRAVERAVDQAEVLRVLDEPIGYEVDFLWPSPGLIAETDGRDPHSTRLAFEHDRVRDQRLMLAGYRVVRFPKRQVLEDPTSVAATMRTLLRGAA